jgi:hypothetical protein
MSHNFVRVHQSLRVTPAMEAGLSDHVWNLEEIIALLPCFSSDCGSAFNIKLLMRILKLKTPVLALYLAGLAAPSSVLLFNAVQFALRPRASMNAFDWLFIAFYTPASLAAFLCEPSSNYEKGLRAHGFPFWIIFAMIQWYLIFLVGLGIYRHFHKKCDKNEPAA